MIGNIIQSEFLVTRQYERASALAFILMAFMVVAAIIYARALGTEEITT
jgi:ABC-type spermidine/putrescine transport system permease subunit I